MHGGEQGGERPEGGFGELAVGGDLAAEYGEQRGALAVQVERVIAGHRRRIGGFVVAQRAYAGERGDHLVAGQRGAEVRIDYVEQIVDLVVAGPDTGRIAPITHVGGADQAEILFVGKDEDNAPVAVLQDVGAFVGIEAGHHHVAALDHPSHAAMVPMGFGAGVGRVGDYYEQGNWYRGGAQQMLFTSWLYGVEHDKFKPRIPAGASQEDLIRISRFYDLAPENPPVDMSEALAHLPVSDILKNVNGKSEIYDKMILQKPNDPAWYTGGLYNDDMGFGVPSFWFCSWYDVSISPNLALFNHVRNNISDPAVSDNQYLVIAPTLHCAYTRATENTIVGERSVGDARLNYDEQIYSWFDMWLKEEENGFKEKTPRVQYYTMGSNQWQQADQWPPKSAEMTPFYLTSKGSANSLYGDGKLGKTKPGKKSPQDSFTYDPMNPVNSYGGNVCCSGNAVKGGAFDQQHMETRNDILIYTSAPLNRGIEVTGFIETTLYVASDARDTDFTIKLIDVYPDGRAYNLDETIQRARYRNGYDKEEFMKKRKVYKIEMTPMSTSNYFEKGHRIRIEISSSNFPRFTRNLNTGGNNFDESEGVVAINQIHHNLLYYKIRFVTLQVVAYK